jgi:transposase
MMGRERNRGQLRLTDVEHLAGTPVVPPDSFYGKMADWGARMVTDDLFADLYAKDGRASVPPGLLAKMLLLMFHDNVSEREAEERTRYDLRWKHALHLGIGEHVDRLALLRFRARLVAGQKMRVVFERFVKLAMDAGVLKANALQVIDSTHVAGAAAVEDTYTLIRHAIRKLLRVADRQQGLRAEWLKQLVRQDYDQDGKPEIDWKDEAARNKLLNELVKDARTLLAEASKVERDTAAQAAYDLLAAVTEQDIETQQDGTVTIRKGVAKDRIASTVDPEMRHGRKSSAGHFTGHKVSVTVEPESHFITNVKAHAGNSHDASTVREIVAEQAALGLKPADLVGDTAYGGAELRHDLERQGVNIVAPVQPEPNTGRFPKSAFRIDLENGTCTCPAGQVTDRIRKDRSTGKVTEFLFPATVCQTCPFRDQCLRKNDKGRGVHVHPHEASLQKARAKQNTPEYRAKYEARPIVERANAELKRHGLRKARYFGRVKLDLQALWTASVLNLKRLFKWLQREPDAAARLSAALAL